MQVREIRSAERELVELQGKIDACINGLQEAVMRTDELRQRFGLRVDAPMWHHDLATAMGEAAHRFVRWGREPAVTRYIEFETVSFYSPRPTVLDIVLAARSIGVVHSDVSAQVRSPFTGEWVRTVEPSVQATNGWSEQALAVRSGSKPDSEAAQLRQLFASLRSIALNYGWSDDAPGPLEWLTDSDISMLCCALVGGKTTAARPWGEPAEGYDIETVRKERVAFARRVR